MRTIPALFLFLLTLLSIPEGSNAQSECEPRTLIDDCKKELTPYSYSNSRTIMTRRGTSREISVSLLSGEKYRLVFNVSDLPPDALIEVYDGPSEKEGRELLMTSKDVPTEQELFIYNHPSKEGGELYVHYKIPNPAEQSCFTFVVGYQLTFVN